MNIFIREAIPSVFLQTHGRVDDIPTAHRQYHHLLLHGILHLNPSPLLHVLLQPKDVPATENKGITL